MSKKEFAEIVVKVGKEKKVVKLIEPNFTILAKAFSELTSGEKPDIVGAGKVVFDACAFEGHQDIIGNPKAYLAACIQASSLVEVAEAELKKK